MPNFVIWVWWENYNFPSPREALEAIVKQFSTAPSPKNAEKVISMVSESTRKYVGFWVSDLENGSWKLIFGVKIIKNVHI